VISVVVPVLNETENVRTLVREIEQAAAANPIREIIYVDDGSTDATLETLLSLRAQSPMLRVVHHDRALGQSAAFHSGAGIATQDLLVFMDGDLQNDPADIAPLFRRYREEEAKGGRAAVLGQRAKRNDSGLRRISSRLANGLRAAVLHDGTRDTGCSLKLIRREDFLNLPYFDHMHRFLPALLMRDGVRLAHVQVSHRARVAGKSKYGFWNRALVGAVDLMGAAWLVRRRLPADYRPREITEVETR
jgi:dolichol-phosphate mannosyltransferase